MFEMQQKLVVLKINEQFYFASLQSYSQNLFNPLKTSPEYTRAGVYEKCML